jgi:hypothetical protein
LNPGDLVLFAWPRRLSKCDEALEWESARIGVITEILIRRPEDQVGDEFRVMHEGEMWSVPEAWCRKINTQ